MKSIENAQAQENIRIKVSWFPGVMLNDSEEDTEKLSSIP
jgi:hypothetical protein